MRGKIIINLDDTVTPLGFNHIVEHIESELNEAQDRWGNKSLRLRRHNTFDGVIFDVVSVGD
jgi:hypothetical protein